MWNAVCDMQYAGRSICGMWYTVCSMQHAVCNIRHAVYSTYNMRYIAYSMKYMIYRMRYAVCGIQYAVCSIQYVVCGMQDHKNNERTHPIHYGPSISKDTGQFPHPKVWLNDLQIMIN